MPIRFRCAHCDKLLGIARRKAGTIVNCPQCSMPLIVPTPEPESPDDMADADDSTQQTEVQTDPNLQSNPQRSAKNASKLFEEEDISKYLDSTPSIQPQLSPATGTKPHTVATVPARSIVTNAPSQSNGLPVPLPAPVAVPMPVSVPTAGGISVSKIILLIFIVFGLVTTAFVGGLFVGRGVRPSTTVNKPLE